MADIKFEIVEELGVISKGNKGWCREVNLVSWNGLEPKYDIRDWSEGHEKIGKGITLSTDEVKTLREIFERLEL